MIMNISTKIVIVLIIYFSGITLVKSQTVSTVQIKDLVLIPEYSTNTIDTTSKQYRLNFKISDASNTSKAYLLFGSAKDSGNILNVQANFIHQGGSNSVSYNNQTNPVHAYTVYIPIQLLKSLHASLSYLTVYIQDGSGNFSNKLYYSVNP